jgi:hypothetical protein
MLHMAVVEVVVPRMELVVILVMSVLPVHYLLVVAVVEELTWAQKRGHILPVPVVQVVVQVPAAVPAMWVQQARLRVVAEQQV